MTAPDPGAPTVSRWRLPAVLAALTLLTRLPGLVSARTFNTDEATLAVGGRALLDGGSLYVDLIDRKPPLPFAAYAAALGPTGGDDLRPVRLLVAVLIALTAVVVAHEARRRWTSPAAWVAGLVVVLGASALGPADAQAANFELFALLPIAVAVAAAARGRAVVAGVALAVAVLCKQPAAITVVPVAWSLWRCGRWRSVAVGGAAGAVAALALAAPFGVGDVVDWALLGTGGYLSVDPADLGVAAVRLLATVALAVAFWGGAWLLVGARPGTPHPGGAPADRDDLDLWLLLGASALAILAGFRFFPHYLLQLLPGVALLAGRGAVRRPAWVRPAAAWGVVASVVAAGLAWTHAAGPVPALQDDVAAYVARHSRPGDTVLVWGNLPEVYWLADRQPAGGFTHSEFVTGYSGGRKARRTTDADVPDAELYRTWLARLRRERPVLVVDTAAADERGGRWFPLAGYRGLADLLAEDYERVATIDGAPVYRLRPEGPR